MMPTLRRTLQICKVPPPEDIALFAELHEIQERAVSQSSVAKC